MKPTLTIDPNSKARFDAAIRERIKLFEGAAAECINERALDVAFRSLKETQKADPNEIRYTLGQTGTNLGKLKSGKTTFNRRKATIRLKEDSFAVHLMGKIIENQGRQYVTPKVRAALMKVLQSSGIEAAAKRLISFRVSSVAFISSGWIPAIRGLTRVVKSGQVKTKANTDGVRQFGKPKGRFSKAKESPAPQATITSTSFGGDPRAQEIGRVGMQKGFDSATAGMKNYIADALRKANVTDK